ncbi:dockerin type I repeat-containing protein [Pseudorhodoferax sp. LjRoot39]|uniref:dockerin type I repeat-containing protein n=1 Tax=Pseudorhodoferax sp. LjRoot39 TaxID=3342328 RepID=UPI003ECEF04C
MYKVKTISKLASAALLFIILHFSTACAAADLVITQPSNGAVFRPGDTFQVSVSQKAGMESFYFNKGVFLNSNGPFVDSGLQSADPYLFTVTIPHSAKFGDFRISAVGARNGTSPTYSKAISITIDSSDSAGSGEIKNISVEPSEVYLNFPGETSILNIYGQAISGKRGLPFSKISYSSNAPNIASIEPSGALVALAPGNAVFTISYKNFAAIVNVVVAQQKLRGDFNGDDSIDVDDINYLNSYLNQSATGTQDARDLNGDGKINALDVRVLTTICSKSRCAR